MHFYKATVKIRKPGDTSATHENDMDNLSAPEVIILRHQFGDDGVVNVRPAMPSERGVKHAEEIDRLRHKYVGRNEHGEAVDVIRQVFGVSPQLPTQLDTEEAEAEETTTLKLPKKQAA
jgi:hypothetical protein